MSGQQISGLEQRLVEKRIIPVAVIESVEDAAPLARTLADASIPVIEVTLRTSCALDCIRAIRRHCPDVLVGAGTVLDAAQVKAALEGKWFNDGFRGAMGELLCAIEEDREPSNSGRNNLNSLAVCFAAVKAADTGRPQTPGGVQRLPP